MRILWASNYSAQSSYAIQTKLLVPRIKALGHDVTIFELSNGTRSPYIANGIQVVSVLSDPLGNDIIQDYASRMRIDAVITLMDVWMFSPEIWCNVPWFPYVPIDQTPVPPGVVRSLNGARHIIAMSKFGVRELNKVGANPTYIPLVYDPAVFHYIDKQEARAALGIPPQAFWVSFVGVNDSIPSRKGLPELLSAWQTFSANHPDACLYLHTSAHGNLAANGVGGVRIDDILNTLRINPAQVRFVDQFDYRTGIPAAKVAQMYAASDVMILPSRGEGFGLPIIEAQACGVPVITTRFAAQEELAHVGWLVEGESEWSYQNAFVIKPGIMSMVEALEAAYFHRNNEQLRRIAADSVTEYQVDNVVKKYWPDALRKMGEVMLDALVVA